MSRGPGKIQKRIVAAFASDPDRIFTYRELAAIAYPGQAIDRAKLEAVRRAASRLAADIGITKCRVALPGQFGWHHRIGVR